MDEEIERLVVSVRADTQAFRGDVEEMRRTLSEGIGGGVDVAGRRIESALLRAVRTGRLGFEDLKRTALGILDEIAASALRTGFGAAFGGGGLVGLGAQLVGGLLGLPGRASGGPVAPGRAYRVGERGPELFVPTASGRIETGAAREARDVRVTIALHAPAGGEPEALARSGRQIAREVRRALERGD